MKQSVIKQKEQEQLRKLKQDNEILFTPVLEYFQNPQTLSNNVIQTLQQVAFFQNNCPEGTQLQDFVTQAIKYMKYESFSFGQIIFNYGDFGDKMYIILKGEAGVYVPKSQEEIEQEQGSFNLKKSKRMLQIDDVLQVNVNNQRYYQNGIYLYHKVFSYFAGQCFGDVALTSDKPRSASLFTITDELHCLSINRIQYKQMCDKTIQEQNRILHLYQKILPGIQLFSISKFIQNLKPISFVCQSILWEKGDEPEYFFIILSGRVEIFTTIEDSKYQSCSNSAFTIKLKRIVLSHMTDGHFVGHEELLDNIPLRKYSCQCSDNTTACYMDAEVFQRIRRNFPDIVNHLQSLAQQNSTYSQKRLHQVKLNIQSYQEQINKTPVPQEKKNFYETLELTKKQSDSNKVLRSDNIKLLTISQSVKRNQEAFHQKYGDKQSQEPIINNPELQQSVQDRIERQYYFSNKSKPTNTGIRKDLSIEIKNIKLNLSKSQSKFNQPPDCENFFILKSHNNIPEVQSVTSGGNSAKKQINQNSLHQKQRLFKKIQQAIRINHNCNLPFRCLKSLHFNKAIKTESDLEQQPFVTSCKYRNERSLQFFPNIE